MHMLFPHPTAVIGYAGLLIAVVLILAGPGVATATGAAPEPSLGPPAPVLGSFWQGIVGNRSRMIQVSFIFIVVGIFILWKK